MYPSVESSLSAEQPNVLGLPQRTVRYPARPGPRIKPQDLVRLILGHRALARRVSVPRTTVALQVYTPGGRPAVLISFE